MLHLKQCSHMFPMFFLCRAQLGAKLSPKGAKLRHVRTELGFHVHQMATIWNPSGSLWAQLQPYDHMTQVWPLSGQPGVKLGPTRANYAASTRQERCFLPLFQFPRFFCFDGCSRRQMPPHRTKLRMLSPTCAQTCPSCAMLGPSWAQVGPKLEPTGPGGQV